MELFQYKVNEEAGLSPGRYTQGYSDQCAKKRQQCQEMYSKPSSKRRRVVLKQERAITQTATEALEGATYQSGNL